MQTNLLIMKSYFCLNLKSNHSSPVYNVVPIFGTRWRCGRCERLKTNFDRSSSRVGPVGPTLNVYSFYDIPKRYSLATVFVCVNIYGFKAVNYYDGDESQLGLVATFDFQDGRVNGGVLKQGLFSGHLCCFSSCFATVARKMQEKKLFRTETRVSTLLSHHLWLQHRCTYNMCRNCSPCREQELKRGRILVRLHRRRHLMTLSSRKKLLPSRKILLPTKLSCPVYIQCNHTDTSECKQYKYVLYTSAF